MMEKHSYVYILASGPYGTLYVGSTVDLVRRIWQHRGEMLPGFTKQYRVKHLVWYEAHSNLIEAARREKQIKKWNRDWNVNLIQASNADWRDLYDEIAI